MEITKTLKERHKNYGSFITGAKISQYLKQSKYLYTSNLSVTQKESLDMIFSKISRILNGDANHIDSWHDICGYAKLIEEELIDDNEKSPK